MKNTEYIGNKLSFINRLLILSQATDNFNLNVITKPGLKINIVRTLNTENTSKDIPYQLGGNSKIKVVFNTSNRNKVEELKLYLKYNPVGIIANSIFDFYPVTNTNSSCPEDKLILANNAIQKNEFAVDGMEPGSYVVFSEDSGFYCDQFPDKLGVRSKRFAMDSLEFVKYYCSNEIYKAVYSGIYSYAINNIVLCEYLIFANKRNNGDKTKLLDGCMLATSANMILVNSKANLKPLISTTGTGCLFGSLRLDDMLNYTETNIHKCKFGFNRLMNIMLEDSIVQYSEVPAEEAIQFNHRQHAFSETIVNFLEKLFDV